MIGTRYEEYYSGHGLFDGENITVDVKEYGLDIEFDFDYTQEGIRWNHACEYGEDIPDEGECSDVHFEITDIKFYDENGYEIQVSREEYEKVEKAVEKAYEDRITEYAYENGDTE